MKKLNWLALGFCAIALVACQGRNRGAVSQKAAEMMHSASNCPQLAEGFYVSDLQKEKYIEIYENKDARVQVINFNGVELAPISGTPTNQKNGSKITVACVSKELRIIARDMKGGVIDTVVKRADDGGLQVEQRSPKVPAVHYSAAGAVRSTLESLRQSLITENEKKTATAVPQNVAPTAPVSPAPQTEPTAPAPETVQSGNSSTAPNGTTTPPSQSEPAPTK